MGSVSKSHLFSANYWWEDGKHFFEVFLYTFTSHKYNSCSFRCLLNKGCICLMNWIDKLRQNLDLCGGFVVLVEGHLEIALGKVLALPLLCFGRLIPRKPLLGMGRAQGSSLTWWFSCLSQSSASISVIDW